MARGAALVRFARLITADEHRAEDLVQEVLAKTYAAWWRIGRLDQPDLYVRRMLVNANTSWWRRAVNREVAVAEPGGTGVVRDSATESAERDAICGAPIDPSPMMLAAVAEGRRIQTRRRSVTVTLAAVTVAAVTVAGVLAPRHPDSANPSPSPSPSPHFLLPEPPTSTDLAHMPDAVGQPGADSRPDLVGTDPGIVHFSLDSLATHATGAYFWSVAGFEESEVSTDDFDILVHAQHTKPTFPPKYRLAEGQNVPMSAPVATTFAGRPAQLQTAILVVPKVHLVSVTWQPSAGLWVNIQVAAATVERGLQLAGQVRFDHPKRCVVPFEIGSLPVGTTVRGCRTDLISAADGQVESSASVLTLGDGQRQLSVQATNFPGTAGGPPRPLTAGPYKVSADLDGRFWGMTVKPFLFTAEMQKPKTPYTQHQVLEVLGSITLPADLNNPTTW